MLESEWILGASPPLRRFSLNQVQIALVGGGGGKAHGKEHAKVHGPLYRVAL